MTCVRKFKNIWAQQRQKKQVGKSVIGPNPNVPASSATTVRQLLRQRACPGDRLPLPHAHCVGRMGHARRCYLRCSASDRCSALLLLGAHTRAEVLITASEAVQPPSSDVRMNVRGITRGPSVDQILPSPTTSVHSR